MEIDLNVQGLTKTYGTGERAIRAVHDVSFAAKPGDVLAIVGPSGSGKTTLLAMLGGLLAPTDGQIVVGGRDVARLSAGELASYRRHTVGFVFQAHHLLPYLTARENLSLIVSIGAAPDGVPKAGQLLTDLGLGERADVPVSGLSGGERQRVAIGRALMNDPALVLVDEPTASLDSARGAHVVRLLVDQVKSRAAIAIVVTHDLEMARMADRVWEMHDGELNISDAHGSNATVSPKSIGR